MTRKQFFAAVAALFTGRRALGALQSRLTFPPSPVIPRGPALFEASVNGGPRKVFTLEALQDALLTPHFPGKVIAVSNPTYLHTQYGLGFSISRELLDDDRFGPSVLGGRECATLTPKQ